MNEQVILSATRRNGGLEVTTRGTGHDQLAAIEVAAASTWQVMAESRHVPPEMATAAIMAAVQHGIHAAATKNGVMREIELDRNGK